MLVSVPFSVELRRMFVCFGVEHTVQNFIAALPAPVHQNFTARCHALNRKSFFASPTAQRRITCHQERSHAHGICSSFLRRQLLRIRKSSLHG
jgi:hypothetical protein